MAIQINNVTRALMSWPYLLSFHVLANLESALRGEGVIGPEWSQPRHGVDVSSIDDWQNPTLNTHTAARHAQNSHNCKHCEYLQPARNYSN